MHVVGLNVATHEAADLFFSTHHVPFCPSPPGSGEYTTAYRTQSIYTRTPSLLLPGLRVSLLEFSTHLFSAGVAPVTDQLVDAAHWCVAGNHLRQAVDYFLVQDAAFV